MARPIHVSGPYMSVNCWNVHPNVSCPSSIHTIYILYYVYVHTHTYMYTQNICTTIPSSPTPCRTFCWMKRKTLRALVKSFCRRCRKMGPESQGSHQVAASSKQPLVRTVGRLQPSVELTYVYQRAFQLEVLGHMQIS